MEEVAATQIARWRWLGSTYTLQRDVFEYDLDGLERGIMPGASPGETFLLADYIDWNVTAAVQELAEVREEFSWKPWAKDLPFVHRERVLSEVVDVMHFLGNILVGMGVTDEELVEAYIKKQRINVSRVTAGNYSAKKGGLSEGSD
jgi:dimeric dUTPase (all-alpha-NTP-PPase superfamily)